MTPPTALHSFITALLFSASGAHAYSLCTTAPYPLEGKTVNPIRIVQSQQSVNGQPYQVSGTITVNDRCTFSIQNFTYTGGPTTEAAVWYGGFTNDALGVSLTEFDPVPLGTTAAKTFSFTTRAGASVSYNDFNEFRFFLPVSNQLLARGVIPGGVTPGSSSTTRPSGTTTSTASAVVTTNSASSSASSSANAKPNSAAGGSSYANGYTLVWGTALAIAFTIGLL